MRGRAQLALLLVVFAGTQMPAVATMTEEAKANARKVGAPEIPDASLCDAAVVRMVVPEFPRSAVRKSAQGWVVLGYDLDGSGSATQIHVISEKPADTFSSAAIAALERSKFAVGVKRSECKTLATFALGPG